MSEQSLQDELLFDRLVDGELSPVERRELLASLDDRPGGWRECALAFLEAQTWRDELGQVVREAKLGPSTSRAVIHHSPRTGRGFRWFAMAASVLVAFTLGLAVREDGLSLRTAAPHPGEHLAATATAPPSAASPTEIKPVEREPRDALTFFVRDESGVTRPVRVPLVDAGTLDEQLGIRFQPGLPENIRSHLEGRGYTVHSQRRYAPLWLENGRPMIVPVEDTRIMPMSEPVY